MLYLSIDTLICRCMQQLASKFCVCVCVLAGTNQVDPGGVDPGGQRRGQTGALEDREGGEQQQEVNAVDVMAGVGTQSRTNCIAAATRGECRGCHTHPGWVHNRRRKVAKDKIASLERHEVHATDVMIGVGRQSTKIALMQQQE